MRRQLNHRLTRGAAGGILAATAALGLTACGEEDATGSTDGSDNTTTEETTDSMEDGATEDTDETDEDAVDVAAIQDDGAGSDGVYDGSYDDELRGELQSFDGERVTISAEVNDIISGQAFTVGGIANPDVEPLLVIHAEPIAFLEQGARVLVTGVVHKAYNVATAEEQLDMQLEEADFEEWGSEPYIETDTVGELTA